MAKEIERKFLVTGDSYKAMAVGVHHIAQCYLSRRIDAVVRVRIKDSAAFLTVKGRNSGMVRNEWEYPVPLADAEAMMRDCRDGNVIEKIRYIVPFGGFYWEVDEFHGHHNGLVVAEIELPDTTVAPPLPPFVGDEVTGDVRYYNSNL